MGSAAGDISIGRQRKLRRETWDSRIGRFAHRGDILLGEGRHDPMVFDHPRRYNTAACQRSTEKTPCCRSSGSSWPLWSLPALSPSRYFLIYRKAITAQS